MPREIHHEIQMAVHANKLHTLSREVLFEYSSALAKGNAYTFYSEKEFPAVCELVARALEHSFDSEANRLASEANKLACEANDLALEAIREASASRRAAKISAWAAIVSTIIAASALIVSIVAIIK